ncbi:hypothetical protein JCM19232_880 [Vibrio ishigakensis]|uniref:Uncharacterized protein n=1 Tax=Vibrio ishigakensis TaxID=1481914 RepID=A0A0B8P7L7_9VIBR|nr:hypothetical protein [Vibrio ishigakensis]GAM60547.1 hypothetical protein JCM19232_880 [Vibrio ishigakensis]
MLLQQLKTEEQIALFIKVQLDKMATTIEGDIENPELESLKLLLESEQVNAIEYQGCWQKAEQSYKSLTDHLQRFLSCIAYGVTPAVMALICDITHELIEDTSVEVIERYSFN